MSAMRLPGRLALLLGRTMRAVHREGLSWRECLLQTYELANRSLFLVISGMAFFGAVMVTIADAQARRFTGNLSIAGPPYFELLVREFGPVMSALLAAARGAASHAAELSTMSVNEQVEALEMSAGDPLSDLLAPRLVAGLLSVPLLCVAGTAAAALSAAWVASHVFGADGWQFVNASYVGRSDVVSALIKALLFGLYIPLAAGDAGLAASGGAEAVGRATTEGVVRACLGCLVLDITVITFFQWAGA